MVNGPIAAVYELLAGWKASNRRLMEVRSRRTDLAVWRDPEGIPNGLLALFETVVLIELRPRGQRQGQAGDRRKLITEVDIYLQ